MKRITLFVLLCTGCFLSVAVSAQIGMPPYSIVNPDSVSRNFYQQDTVQGDRITFRVDHSLGTMLQICNERYTDVFADMIAKYPSGLKPFEKEEMCRAISMQPIIDAFLAVFSPEEIRVLAANKNFINVCYALNRDGSIREVGFAFWGNDPHLCNIPPQYLEKLEELILPKMRFTVPGWYDRYNLVNICHPIKFVSLAKKLPTLDPVSPMAVSDQ